MKEVVNRFFISPAGLVTVATAIAFLLISTPADSKTKEVKCDKGDSIQEALDGGKVGPGDKLLLSGTCNENVIIRAEHHRITIDGQHTARVAPTDGRYAFLIKGDDIRIDNLTITNGGTASRGVRINNGEVLFTFSTIEGFKDDGILMGSDSHASFFSVNLLNNGESGIDLVKNSYADFKNSRIENNGLDGFGPGIYLAETSSATVVDSEIVNNNGRGMLVLQNSHALISRNNVSGNFGDGVWVERLANVQLLSNGTDPANPNEAYGVGCDSGQVNGDLTQPFDSSLDPLHGKAGKANISEDCFDRVKTE